MYIFFAIETPHTNSNLKVLKNFFLFDFLLFIIKILTTFDSTYTLLCPKTVCLEKCGHSNDL